MGCRVPAADARTAARAPRRRRRIVADWRRARGIRHRAGCMAEQLAGRVALVTGGGSGIGEGACVALALAGAAVGIVDLDEIASKAVAERIQATGARAL